ncbi:MAG TPA: Uma2 family endonuclease [Candidatus Limnocylindrales bacterium]
MTITLHQPLPDGTWRPEDIESTEPLNYEILDGNLVLMWPVKSLWHQTLILEIAAALHNAAPEGYRARPELTIGYFRPGAKKETLREPDVVVLRPGADARSGNVFDPRDVALAVEVESPSTAAIDRLDKVGEYARAGVQAYWRVEQTTDNGAIVHVYEIDEVSGRYGLVRSIGPMDSFLMRVPYQVMIDPATMTASLLKR